MKAAALVKPKSIEIIDTEIPKPGNSDVLIEVKSCGVCATDVKKYTGDSKAPFYPFILGHEPAGVIVESGQDVGDSLKPGTRVVVAPVITCGECYACKSGAAVSQGMGMCSNYKVIGYSMNGAFAEYLVVPASVVYPIPHQLSFRDAALVEPVAACANGVMRIKSQTPGIVAVIGAGFMGLVSIQLLKLLGNQVIAVDLMEERRQLAAKLGADLVIDPAGEDALQKTLDFSNNRGVEGVICAIGNRSVTEQGLSMLMKGGTMVLLASAPAGTRFEVDLNKLHYDQSYITGSVSYTGAGFQWVIRLLSQGQLAADALITHSGALEKTSEFLEMTGNLQGIKKVILF